MPTIPTRTPKPKQNDPFYQTPGWKQLRTWFFSVPENNLCRHCKKKDGREEVAFICDHILPRRWFPELTFETTNLEGLCRHCDQIKRVKEKAIRSREHAYIILKDYL